jgi:hypothetical protein
MNVLVRIGAVALAMVVGACSASEMPSQPREPSADVPIIRLRSDPYSFAFNSGLDKPARIVVRDDAGWQAVWRDIYRGSSPMPPAPTIDFSREMVLVAALGARGTGGFDILIEGATEADDRGLNVAVRSTSPGNCPVTLAFTQPVDIARLPIRTGKVEFTERSEVRHCQ